MRSVVARTPRPRGRPGSRRGPGSRLRAVVRGTALGGLVAAAVGVAGCGGGSGGSTSTADRAAVPPSTSTTAPATPTAPPSTSTTPPTATAPGAGATPTPPAHRPPLARVPQSGRGLPDPSSRRRAERWFAEVRTGHPERAAALMADGTRFVNGDAVLLRDRATREAAAASLPCGAVPVRTTAASGGYVVLELRLTSLAGRSCSGAGSPVRVAIRVRRGRIDDWVRLGTPAAPPVPDGTSV